MVVREHIPLEQGLRLGRELDVVRLSTEVREHIPLEQGLRPHSPSEYFSAFLVREHIPLEQGLRQRTLRAAFCGVLPSESIFH